MIPNTMASSPTASEIRVLQQLASSQYEVPDLQAINQVLGTLDDVGISDLPGDTPNPGVSIGPPITETKQPTDTPESAFGFDDSISQQPSLEGGGGVPPPTENGDPVGGASYAESVLAYERRREGVVQQRQIAVRLMRRLVALLAAGIEQANNRLQILNLDGWAQSLDLEELDDALGRLYTLYWNRDHTVHPLTELGFVLGSSMVSYHFTHPRPAPGSSATASPRRDVGSGMRRPSRSTFTANLVSSGRVPPSIPEEPELGVEDKGDDDL